jgi:3'-phosphoadenosine 5'-phosphosulfate sulfotransferase (PAPS reductase)/FAD synthetase
MEKERTLIMESTTKKKNEHTDLAKKENKHTNYDLAQMQSLPLSAKIVMTKARIKEWYDAWDGNVYVSFSGGKDSTVLLDIVRSIYPEVPAVYVDTGLEYPEIKDFVKSHENVTILRPKMSFKQVIEKYGYPVASKNISQKIYILRHYNLSDKLKEYILGGTGKFALTKRWRILLDAPFEVSHKCCDVMKKSPFHAYDKKTDRKPFLASMADESAFRRTSWQRDGCNIFDAKNPQSRPMSFWTEQDILEYLNEKQIPYCSVYGKIVFDRQLVRYVNIRKYCI